MFRARNHQLLRRGLWALSIVLLPAIVSAESPKKNFTKFPAAGVKLEAPKGFVRSNNFQGLTQESAQSSIMVAALPAPYSEVSGSFNKETMGQAGVRLLTKKKVEVGGRNGVLLKATQTVSSVSFNKWILLVDNQSVTSIVTGVWPTSKTTEMDAKLKKAVMSSVFFKPNPAAVDVGFTVTPSKKLDEDLSFRMTGNTLGFKRPGAELATTEPVFVATHAPGNLPEGDRREFAVYRMRNLTQARVSDELKGGPIVIDGMNGYEFVAEATDRATKTPLFAYQVMLFDPSGSYYMMLGMGDAKSREAFLPEYKAMAKSFKRTRR